MQGHALGRSRGGFSTKIHLKSDFDGHPLAFHLTGGEVGDSPLFKLLLDLGPDVKPRAALADKGYDAKANRALARARGIAPAIPFKSNAKDPPAFFPKALYMPGRAMVGWLSLAPMAANSGSRRRSVICWWISSVTSHVAIW